MIIDLETAEVEDIVKVLGAMPTEANAWPLRQKVISQYEAQKPKKAEESGEDS